MKRFAEEINEELSRGDDKAPPGSTEVIKVRY